MFRIDGGAEVSVEADTVIAIHVLGTEGAHARIGIVQLGRSNGIAIERCRDLTRESALLLHAPLVGGIVEHGGEDFCAREASVSFADIERVAIEAQAHERE